MFLMLTIFPIVFQIPLFEYIGADGCYGFWFIQNLDMHTVIISGFGMAVYRLLCYENLFMKSLLKKLLIKKILIAQSFGILFQGLTSVVGMKFVGWEKSFVVQYCINLSPVYADIVNAYSQGSIFVFGKILRTIKIVIIQGMVIGEFLIYVKIMFSIWKHDKNAKDKDIISPQDRKQRNHKNVITLYGQAATFLVKLIISIYVLIYHFYIPVENRDPSHLVISFLISHTIVSVTQFLCSHELRNFVFNH